MRSIQVDTIVVTPAPPLKSAAAHVRESLAHSGDGPVKARVRAAIRGLSVAAIGADDRARIVVANAAAASLTGYSVTELVDLTVPDITASSDRPHTDVLWKAFLTHGQQSGEYDIRRKDGSVVTVEYLAITNAAPGCHLSLLRVIQR